MVEQGPLGAGAPGDPKQKWSFARVVQLMYEQERSGILDVSGADGEWQIHLRDGQIVNVVPVEGRRWLLGDVLIASDAITEGQLLKALKRHKRSGERLGSVLVDSNLVSRDVLKKYLDLQMRETLFPLFQMLGTTVRFRKEDPEPLLDATAIPIPFVLKEAARRIREWPLLEKRVPSSDALYAKEPGTIREILGSQGGGVRAVDPDEPVDEEAALEGEIGGNERIVYYYVNGEKTVAQLAMASGLGEFETTKALYRLVGREYVRLLAEEGQGEKKKERTVFPILFRIVFYVFLVALVGLLAVWRVGGLGAEANGLLGVADAHVIRALQEPQRERLRMALDVHYAETGAFPGELSQLVDDGLLRPDDLSPELLGGTPDYLRLGGGDRYVLRIE